MKCLRKQDRNRAFTRPWNWTSKWSKNVINITLYIYLTFLDWALNFLKFLYNILCFNKTWSHFQPQGKMKELNNKENQISKERPHSCDQCQIFWVSWEQHCQGVSVPLAWRPCAWKDQGLSCSCVSPAATCLPLLLLLHLFWGRGVVHGVGFFVQQHKTT